MQLTVDYNSSYDNSIYIGGKLHLKDDFNLTIDIIETFEFVDGFVYLVGFNSGGMACSMEFRVYDLRNNRIIESEKFGDCHPDITVVSVDENIIQ